MKRFLFLFTSLILLWNSAAVATTAVYSFPTQQQATQFQKITQELRCVVCQNQSIAESNADIAQDIRLQIYNLLIKGASEQEVKNFLVQRYGDFILYNPPLQDNTLILWMLPLILLFLSLLIFIVVIRKAKTKVSV